MSEERCDPEVFENGSVVAIFHASQAVTEPWVQSVARESGQRVDWSYAGGWAHVQYLGDGEKVREAIRKLLPELKTSAEKCPRGWGLTIREMPQ
jgi:hypothetical protein